MSPLGYIPQAVFMVMLTSLGSAEELYQADCRSPLGMQSGEVEDGSIRASSSYDESSVGPQNGRIRTERNGGAWCPKSQIAHTVYEWLEVNFHELKVITLVETQGRFGNGQGQEYAEQYILEYQRAEGKNWIKFRNRTQGMIFPGNINTYTTVLREINPPIVARKIRIVPYSAHPRTICMRVELYGCPWEDGIISYSMPQGEKRGSEVDLYDFIYDGKVIDHYLSGGLGQLTDRDKGETNFRLDPMGIGKRGYQWIGWKNDTDDRPPVEIVFEFDQVRNFTNALFYSNNMFSKDVRVFRMAKIWFSISGKYYQKKPVVYLYMRDTVMEYARNVLIQIKNRIAKYIKVQLYFDSRWLMLSEVQFVSKVASGNYTAEGAPGDESDVLKVGSEPDVLVITESVNDGKSDHGVDDDTGAELDDQYIGIIIGALGALILLVCAIVIFIVVRRRKQKYSNGKQMKPVQTQHVTLNLDDLRALTNSNGKVLSNGNVYNSIATSEIDSEQDAGQVRVNGNGKMVANGDTYREPYDGIQGRCLPDLPALKTPESGTDTMTSREYAVPDLTKMPNGATPMGTFSSKIYREETPSPPMLPPHPQALYGGMDTAGLQGCSGNSMYAVPNSLDLLWKDDLAIIEFPRDSLQFIEKLGEGQFGEVHLCESFGIAEILGEDFLINRTGGTVPSMLVAVKTLRQNADDQARADFHKEVKIMSRLKDNNIVRVLGMCTGEEPLCMIVEYMKYGDLHQFLQQHVPLESTLARTNSLTLSYGCLIYMSTQIASGMKYLETLNMVHRDLATRNCLVGHFYTIKISDFGMSRSLYSGDYYRIEGKAVLPIRWMAWESLLLGKFSTKSDVWSFAVTIWELLTFARDQPYSLLSDEQVIENCGHLYRNDGDIVLLPPPPNCPKEIFDLLVECWNREECSRPSFREIQMFMMRKNMGYDPRDERHSTPTRKNHHMV